MRWLLLILVAACDPDPIPSSDGGVDLAQTRSFSFDDGGAIAVDLAMPALPQHCPCPLGSYCDLATNSCKRGCLGDDHCPMGQICDTSVYACALVCKTDMDCPLHLACDDSHWPPICRGCASDWDDCNHDPNDGCETSLTTNSDCGKCGQAATTMCSLDMDGDGYVVAGSGVVQCQCGAHRLANPLGIDCDDGDYQVHPNQMSFFDMPRKSGGFDYDCDGKETGDLDYTVSDTCFLCSGDYWVSSVPPCGTTGKTWGCDYDNAAMKCQQYTNSALLRCH